MSTKTILEFSDEELCTLAVEGHRSALERLLERHAPTAISFAGAMLPRREDALDVAQTALVRIAHELTHGWRGKPFKLCLYTCVHHAAVNFRIAQKSRLKREELAAQVFTQKESEMPLQNAERAEQLSALREELFNLPEETASLLVLHHLEGLPIAAVAQKSALSEEACKKRISRGREELRGRLERRGIALASVALLATLDQVCAAGKALAAEIDPQAVQQLVQHASSGAVAAAAGAGSATSSTGASGATGASSASAPLSTSSNLIQRTYAMAVRHPFAVSSGLAALLALLFLTFSAPTVSPAADASNAPGSGGTKKSEAPKSPAGAEKTGAPGWQTPRFLVQGAVSPQEISAAGPHVLLAARGPGATDTQTQYTLFTSGDRGETWSELLRTSDVITQVAVDERGQHAWLTAPDTQRFPKKLLWHANTFKTPNAPAETVFDFPTGSLNSQAVLLNVDGGHWVFADQSHLKMFKGINGPDAEAPTRDSVQIAFGTGHACPKTVGAVNLPDETGMAAWALSPECAGFVSTQNKWQTLVHFITRDQGKTWTPKTIPFSYAPDSGSALEQVIPLMLKRDGQRLALVVEAQFLTKKGSENPQDAFFQHFLLTSPDLGASWKSPLPVTKPQLEYASISLTGLHLTGETVYLTTVSQNAELETYAVPNGTTLKIKPDEANPFAATKEKNVFETTISGRATAGEGGSSSWGGASFTTFTTRLLASTNNGASWSNHHALDALGQKSSNALLAGSGADLHVAIFNEPSPISVKFEDETGVTFRHDAEQYLVVRSLTSQALAAPQTPPPASFKETKAPVPTPFEF